MPDELSQSNASELTQIAEELGATVLRGWLQYPGPETGDWEIGPDVLPDVLYELRDRQVILIVAPLESKPMRLCGICGFELGGPGELCLRCALINEETAAAISESRRVVRDVQRFLNRRNASDD